LGKKDRLASPLALAHSLSGAAVSEECVRIVLPGEGSGANEKMSFVGLLNFQLLIKKSNRGSLPMSPAVPVVYLGLLPPPPYLLEQSSCLSRAANLRSRVGLLLKERTQLIGL